MKAKQRRHIHAVLLILWVVPGLPLSYVLRNSVPWVVVMSWYAIVATHAAGWSAETPVETEE